MTQSTRFFDDIKNKVNNEGNIKTEIVDEKNNEPTDIASSSNQSMKRSKDLKMNNIKKIKTIDD